MSSISRFREWAAEGTAAPSDTFWSPDGAWAKRVREEYVAILNRLVTRIDEGDDERLALAKVLIGLDRQYYGGAARRINEDAARLVAAQMFRHEVTEGVYLEQRVDGARDYVLYTELLQLMHDHQQATDHQYAVSRAQEDAERENAQRDAEAEYGSPVSTQQVVAAIKRQRDATGIAYEASDGYTEEAVDFVATASSARAFGRRAVAVQLGTRNAWGLPQEEYAARRQAGTDALVAGLEAEGLVVKVGTVNGEVYVTGKRA